MCYLWQRALGFPMFGPLVNFMNDWTISKQALLRTVKTLDLVPVRPGILSSEFFQVTDKGKGVVQFALASEIKGEFSLSGTGRWPFEKGFYLDRRTFVPFVLAAVEIKNDVPFHFSNGKGALIVRHGKRKAQYDGQPRLKGYGLDESEVGAKIKSRLELTSHIKHLIQCAIFCAANDDSTPQIKCVYIRPRGKIVDIFATNKSLLYQGKSKDRITPPVPIPFPLFLVGLLDADELEEIQWKQTYVCLKFKHGQIWQSVSASARKKFPADHISEWVNKSKSAQLLFQVPTKKFSAVISRLGGYLTAVRRQDWMLEISGKKGAKEIILFSAVPQTNFKERLVLENALAADFKAAWPLDMLLPVFDCVKTKDKGQMLVRYAKGRSYVSMQDISLVVPGVK